MTMVCIVGDSESIKGCGKTMTLTFLQYMDYLKGRTILSNVEYGFPHHKLDVIQMVDDLEADKREKYMNVSIGIDEAHLFMPSGSMDSGSVKEAKDLIINFLYQTRKLEIDVYYVTHRAMNVHHKIRSQIELVLMARKFHTSDGSHCIFDRCKEEHYIEVANANDVESFITKEPIYINPEVVGKLYPTMQLLAMKQSNYFRIPEPRQPKTTKRTIKAYEPEEYTQEDIPDDTDEVTEVEVALNKVNADIARLEQEEAQEEIEAENKIIQEEEHKDLSKSNIYTKRRIINKRK